MMDFIDFNDHIVAVLPNEFGGSEKKRTVILDDNQKYLLKFPDPTREIRRDISYINNAISEYIGCHIFAIAGFEVQSTILGRFIDENNHEKIACACLDIRGRDEQLHEMEKLELEYLDEKEPLTFKSVKKLLEKTSGINSDYAYQEYCRRFIIDALTGNPDRHNGNWGVIVNSSARTVRVAPVYDCGSSLSSLLTEDEITRQNLVSNEINNATSAIKDESGCLIRYRDYLLDGANPDINRALQEVVPRIDMESIKCMIRDIPYISQERKDFYIQMLSERYEKILIPALEKSLGISKSKEYKQWNSKVLNAIYQKYIMPCESASDFGILSYKDESGAVHSLDYTKKDGYVFFTKDDVCVGMLRTEKSNLNICKFVQSARQLGIAIDQDIALWIEEGRKQQFDKTDT